MDGFVDTFYEFLNSPLESLFFLGAIIFAAFCSLRVNTTFSKYSRVFSEGGMQAHQAARVILDSNGLYDVQIMRCAGNLTDHYDPRNKTLSLSDTVFGSTSVAAIGVAAHECGHAVQDARAYGPMKLRKLIAPAVSFCSRTWLIVLIVGGFLASMTIIHVAIAFLAAVVIFQLVTLPVELDASRRAMDTLTKERLLYGKELKYARKVLSAAAMTYVAGLLTALAQLFRVMARYNRRR